MTEPFILLCMRQDGHPEPPIASKSAQCSICTTDIWVSNNMHPLVVSGEASAHCETCAMAIAEADDSAEFAIHPRQEPDLAARRISTFAQDFIKHMNERKKQ
jgi:hypothetical protein